MGTRTLVIFILCILCITPQIKAQEINITGKVTSEKDGLPLPGVNVIVQGTARGTQTDFDGIYQINASKGEVIEFSFIGLASKTVVVGNETQIDVILNEDLEQLEDVVITALGIAKSRKSLTYAAQDINADELQKVKQTNPINSLSGKVAGVVINRSSSGAGGSVKVTLRGNASLSNNQPLYVVDGIPLSNPSGSQPTNSFGETAGGNRDGGDVLSLINPDDIESLTVLRGASASALYGSAGSNGVILITTKKGRSGNFKVNVSSNITMDEAAYYLDLKEEANQNVKDFFNTGITSINTVSASGGTDKAQTYFSYSNTFSSGILPTNQLKQHTINLRETAKFFDERLSINANVLMSSQKIDNRPINGIYYNPLVGVYAFDSPGQRLTDFENDFERFNEDRLLFEQFYYVDPIDELQNPYWNVNRNTRQDSNEKLVTNISLDLKLTNWLSLKTRGTYDRSELRFESQIFGGSRVGTLAPPNGRYVFDYQEIEQLYGDLIFNINKNFGKISLSSNVGTIVTANRFETFFGDSGVGSDTSSGLQFANVFSVQNFDVDINTILKQSSTRKRVNSVFGSATIGFDEKVFLDLTYRNDWSSTLPDSENSYDYPSIGVTAVLSEIFNMGDAIDFAKIRGSYAEVGNDLSANQLAAEELQPLIGGGVVTNPDSPDFPVPPLGIIRPERQRSYEFGTEWQFFNNRLGFDLGYYSTSTINQYLEVPVSVGSGFANRGVNSGDIINKGFEGSVFAVPFRNENFTWRTNVNFASNRNEVLEISNPADGVEIDFYAPSPSGTNAYGLFIVEGGSFGDIYARLVKKNEEGLPLFNLDDTGNVVIAQEQTNPDIPAGLSKVGNANPDFTLGWNNSFSFKNINLDFLIDGRFGGETLSLTQAITEANSNNTTREAENGTVQIVNEATNEVTEISAQEYYSRVGGRNGLSGEYVYSATNVRLAELALGYDFKLSESSFFRSIKASLIGNNLFFFYKDAPHDPNISLSTGNGLQGVDIFGLPSTRSFGLNINLIF